MNQAVDSELRSCPVPPRADANHPLGYRSQNRLHPIDQIAISGGHDREGARLDRRNTARDRAIEKACTAAVDLGPHLENRLGSHRARVHGDRAGHQPLGYPGRPEIDRFQSIIVGETGDHHLGPGGGRGRG